MNSSLFLLTTTLALIGPVGPKAGGPYEPTLSGCLVTLINRSTVSAEEAGVLVELLVKSGDMIKEGTLLARTSDDKARMALLVAQAEKQVAHEKFLNDINVRYSKAAADVALYEYKVTEEANKKVPGTKPQVEIDRLLLAHRRAALQIEQAVHEQKVAGFERDAKEAQVKAADNDVTRRQIKGPIPGEVVEVMPKLGEWVNPGDPICRVLRLDKLRVEGFLKLADVSRDKVRARPVTVLVQMTGGQVEQFEGEIEFVSPEIQAGGEYRVWAAVNNRIVNNEWLLCPGLNATMTIHINQPAVARLPSN